jgi:PPM family protein phosphatase
MPIGEFSDRSGLSSKRLRTYAAEGLLVPAAVDPATGYRYYSPDQLPRSHLIDALRRAGIPLADIRPFLSLPSSEQLDAWSDRLETEATSRQQGLAAARRLLAMENVADPLGPTQNPEEASVTKLRSTGRTEKGPVRAKNEDAVFASDRLALIADGMGGLPGGDIASGAAIGIVRAAFRGLSAEELRAAIRAANWAIWDRAAAYPELEGMGTTVCAVGLLEDGRLAIANVGDSRAYLWREDTLTQLTRDHSVTAELVESGNLRTEEARNHPHFGILTRALGVGPDIDIDCTTIAVEKGDRFVLCSDGLSNELSDADIAKVMAQPIGLTSVVDTLITEAVDHGGRDNVSVVVAEIAA